MTLNEIAYNIKNIVEGGISGEDSTLSIRQIKAMVHYHRSKLIFEYSKGGKRIAREMTQTISKDLTDGTIQIPNLVGFSKNRGIVDVVLRNDSTIPSSEQFNLPIVNESEKEFFEMSRFAPADNRYYATISYNPSTIGGTDGRDNIMYIYNNPGELVTGKTVFVSFIAANPEKVKGFNAGAQYPIPDELVSILIKNILAIEFSIYLKTDSDNMNNSRNDAKKVAVAPKQKQQSSKSKA
jgi:hypothetical protein|tara:strand:+ start:4099 stop:4812 length:714 start_codon:yes stop_codon:yes gene_type:complete